MMTSKRRVDTQEFKQQSVKLISEQGDTVAELLVPMVLLIVGLMITRLVTDSVRVPWNRVLSCTGIRWGRRSILAASRNRFFQTSLDVRHLPQAQLSAREELHGRE